VDPAALGGLLAAVDARVSIGATLSVSVPLATTVPLLATGGPGVAGALAGVLAGTACVALAATDDGAGSDLSGLRTELTVDGAGLRLTGTKRWIANAVHSEHLLVLARHRPGRHFTSFTWVLVPSSAPGVAVEPADTTLFRDSGTGHIHLADVRLPRAHVLGGIGRGLPLFARHIAVERLAGALWGVALCRRALAVTLRYLTERGLWEVDAIRQRVAASLVRVRQLRALTAELADRVARRHDTTAAALLKAAVGMTVEHVLGECAHLQGAHGFATGGAQELRAQAALFGLGGGTTEVVLSVLGDSADAVLAELGQ
jgi:citronellyl-CoA dehydrogenase